MLDQKEENCKDKSTEAIKRPATRPLSPKSASSQNVSTSVASNTRKHRSRHKKCAKPGCMVVVV